MHFRGVCARSNFVVREVTPTCTQIHSQQWECFEVIGVKGAMQEDDSRRYMAASIRVVACRRLEVGVRGDG